MCHAPFDWLKFRRILRCNLMQKPRMARKSHNILSAGGVALWLGFKSFTLLVDGFVFGFMY